MQRFRERREKEPVVKPRRFPGPLLIVNVVLLVVIIYVFYYVTSPSRTRSWTGASYNDVQYRFSITRETLSDNQIVLVRMKSDLPGPRKVAFEDGIGSVEVRYRNIVLDTIPIGKDEKNVVFEKGEPLTFFGLIEGARLKRAISENTARIAVPRRTFPFFGPPSLPLKAVIAVRQGDGVVAELEFNCEVRQ